MPNNYLPILAPFAPAPPTQVAWASTFDLTGLPELVNKTASGTGAVAPAFDSTISEYGAGSMKFVTGTVIGNTSVCRRILTNAPSARLGFEIGLGLFLGTGAFQFDFSVTVRNRGTIYSLFSRLDLANNALTPSYWSHASGYVAMTPLNFSGVAASNLFWRFKSVIDLTGIAGAGVWDHIELDGTTYNDPAGITPGAGGPTTDDDFILVDMTARGTVVTSQQINIGHLIYTVNEP